MSFLHWMAVLGSLPLILTLSVVALSIVLHGLTMQHVLARYERQQGRSEKP